MMTQVILRHKNLILKNKKSSSRVIFNMNHPDKKEPIKLCPNKSNRNTDRLLKSINSDRRPGKDRRSSFNPDYFLHGGIERRNRKERRYFGYMTD
jgi:hypothetical protein